MPSQKSLTIQLSVFCLAIITIMATLVMYCAQQAQTISADQPFVPTKTISADLGIGGVQSESSTEQKHGTTTTSSTPTATKAPLASTASSIHPSSDLSSAPKQQAIASTVAKEYEYRALQVPNDPLYSTFTDAGGMTHTPFALQRIGAPAVWDMTSGSPAVIAVIDTGFALGHEDLNTQWYTNTKEMGSTTSSDACWTGEPQDKSNNDCDDDHNGYVDDWRGWNFYGRYKPTANPCAADGLGTYIANNNPMAGASGDDILYDESKTCFNVDAGDPFAAISHGTSTAGIAGAASNNNLGIATLNWQAKIMPLQVLGDDGSGWTSKIIAAIRYAVDNGADIISMSLGGPTNDPALQAAIDYAYDHNVIVIAAAGNCGTGTEEGCDSTKPGAMSYPALSNHVISVGATDKDNVRADFSSYGPGLDVVAPGYGELISPYINRPLVNGSPSTNASTFNFTNAYSAGLAGTSFSTPYVANVVSLIKSVKPSYTADDVTAIIDGTAQKVSGMGGQLYTSQYGHGLIDAAKVATIAQSLSATTSTPELLQTGDYRNEHSFSSGALMSSGCRATTDTYCTVRLSNTLTHYDRYLPYSQAISGSTEWQWSGTILTPGEWRVSSVQGSIQSGSYLLFSK